MSGTGSSMISTPVWLMLGFPLPVAIASNDVNGALWTTVAARNYLRGHKIDWRLVACLVFFGLAGAYGGAMVIMRCRPQNIERIIGCIILGVVVLSYVHRKFGVEESAPKWNRVCTGLLGLPLGFYEAFFGAGNGIFTSTAIAATRGLRILEALGYYYIISCVWCIFASVVYISNGHWDLKLMIPSVIGSFTGASIGSRIGRKQGVGFVKTVSIVVGSILGIKMIFGL